MGPITLVLDDFKPFIVDCVYTLVFEDILEKVLLIMAKARTRGYDM